MYKFKKLSLTILAGCLTFSMVLSGCGADKKAQVNQENQTAAYKEPYQIQWYFVNTGAQRDVAFVEEAANKYLKDKLNATIKLNCLDWGTYSNKMNTMMAAAEAFDIAYQNSNAYKQNAAKGSIIEIDELLNKFAPKTKALLGDDFLKGARINNKLYGIPANKDKAHHFGFMYRKDIADKYNIDMQKIKSFEELLPVLGMIKEKEPDMVPLGMGGSHTPDLLLDFDRISSIGAFYPEKSEGKVVNIFETPEYKQMIDLVRKAYQAGYIYKDAVTAKNFPQQQKGQLFVYVEQLKTGKAEEVVASTNQPYEAVDITPPRMTNADATGAIMTISRTSKDPERAMSFLELFNTDAYLNNLINFGIEGKHYAKKSENVIEPISGSGYNQVGMQWEFGNIFINYLLPNENPDKFKLLSQYNDASIRSKYLGFCFNLEPVKIESAACENVMKEYQQMIEFGTVDPDEYLPKFIDKLKKAGSDKIIAEEQKQYDQWLAESKK